MVWTGAAAVRYCRLESFMQSESQRCIGELRLKKDNLYLRKSLKEPVQGCHCYNSPASLPSLCRTIALASQPVEQVNSLGPRLIRFILLFQDAPARSTDRWIHSFVSSLASACLPPNLLPTSPPEGIKVPLRVCNKPLAAPSSSGCQQTHSGTACERKAGGESLASSASVLSAAESNPSHVLAVATGEENTMRRRPLTVDTAEVGVRHGGDIAAPTSMASCQSAPSAGSSPSFSFLRKNSNQEQNQKMAKPSNRWKQRRSRSVGDNASLDGADQNAERERPDSRCSLPNVALKVDACSDGFQEISRLDDDMSLSQSGRRNGSRMRRSIGRRNRGRDKGERGDCNKGQAAVTVGRKREPAKPMIRGRRASKSPIPTNDEGLAAQQTKNDKIIEFIAEADAESFGTGPPKAIEFAPPEEEIPSESQIPLIDPIPASNFTGDNDNTSNKPLISILHHSFIESCLPTCGSFGQIVQSSTELTHDEEARTEHRLDDIEDPTVQESVECVFAHQLDHGLEGLFYGDEDEDSEEMFEHGEATEATEGWQRIPSPISCRDNSFRFLDSATSRSRTSSLGSESTVPIRDQHRLHSSLRNRSAVASILQVPHPLVHSTSSDVELVAAARRTASDPDGLKLPPRPLSTTAAASKSKTFGAGLPPKPVVNRGTTTGSLRFTNGGDDAIAHELRRRTWSRRVLDSQRLVYIGTIGREGSDVVGGALAHNACARHASSECVSCRGRTTNLPHAPPHFWPQAPLLLRPTPGSGTKIRGIRYSGSTDYIWRPPSVGHNHAETEALACWSQYLQKSWGAQKERHQEKTKFCSECAPIPVNNGNEAPGKSLVVDFESNLFIGSLLLRIRNAKGTTPAPYDDSFGYFTGMNRRYQTVVRGMFKKDDIAMTDCVTGQVLNRKCGKLPPKMLLRAAVKIISYFAPQLKVKLDADKPYCISPLGSTPQVMKLKRENGFNANYQADQSIEDHQEEPEDLSSSLLSLMGCQQSGAQTSVARAKARKKAFDKLYAENDKSLVFDESTEYSFEFLQHLLDFDDFGVDLGNMIGKVLLKEMLDGQPLKFMAAQRKDGQGDKARKGKGEGLDLDYLWSFDIFHEDVYEDCRDE